MQGMFGSLASSSSEGKLAVQTGGYGANDSVDQEGARRDSKSPQEASAPNAAKKGARLSWRDAGNEGTLHDIVNVKLTEEELAKIVGAESNAPFASQVSCFSEKSTGWRRDFNDGVTLNESADDFGRQLSSQSVCTIVETV
eukprot:TRINITY_DN57664_c0_g1_i1.p1 TRINITY_DN57664_c0_g1~~TRINITY_DN57664_c0_g1_i1.p1  ORF type:complete len:141 (+),score=29.06 TRINITY_DN57664_c0_g1_i1:213-635(+)